MSYDNRPGVIWVDGAFQPWSDARTHILTQGLHYGSSVFEGERAYDGRIFRSSDHARRLHHSAARLGMALSFSVEALEAAKAEVLARSGFSEAYIRPIVWRGSREMDLSTKHADVHCAIAAWPWEEPTPDPAVGIRMTIADWRRPPRIAAPVDAKASGLYVIATMAKDRAHQQGYDDALMLDCEGLVAEATGANVFFVRDGEIFTPRPDNFLNGITRQTVISLARGIGLAVHETAISPDELDSFSECFLTGTAAEVTSVREIAGRMYRPAALTHQIVEAYHGAVRSQTLALPPSNLWRRGDDPWPQGRVCASDSDERGRLLVNG